MPRVTDDQARSDAPRPLARDTEVERLRFEHWRSLDSVAKLRILSEQSIALHRLSFAGLTERYPDASEEELQVRAACQRYGRDVVERCTGIKLEW